MTQPGQAADKLRAATERVAAQRSAVREEAARIAQEREQERPSTQEQS